MPECAGLRPNGKLSGRDRVHLRIVGVLSAAGLPSFGCCWVGVWVKKVWGTPARGLPLEAFTRSSGFASVH